MAYISVILPVYNGEEFIADAIDSVLAQTFQEWELIIINDGSTDSSGKLADDYAKNDSRIRVFNQTNKGLSAARNSGIFRCIGEIIGFLDADDRYLPDCLTVISNQFQKLDADLLITGYFYFKENSKLHTHYFSDAVIPYSEFLKANLAPPVSHFIKKSIADQLGGFDTMLKSCEDWDFWIRAAKLGTKIHSISEVLVGYRYVPNSMSRNPKVMYDSLTEVTRRAGLPDFRLPENAPFNKAFHLDYPIIQKNHLIRLLGVLLHQGKVAEAVDWYHTEQKKWNWQLEDSDWKKLSSYLSWAYFLEAFEIQKLFSETRPILINFFRMSGYSDLAAIKLVNKILSPQLKKLNHYRYGVIIGAIFNRFSRIF